MGNRVGTGYLPSGLIHCHLQQLVPCLPLQRTSHTQDLQMPARRLAPTIREHSPGLILDELFSNGGDVLLSPSAWPGENCGSPRGAVAWGCAYRDISHLSCPLLPQDAPIWFWAETLQLRLVAVPSPAGERLLPPGIKAGGSVKEGWLGYPRP